MLTIKNQSPSASGKIELKNQERVCAFLKNKSINETTLGKIKSTVGSSEIFNSLSNSRKKNVQKKLNALFVDVTSSFFEKTSSTIPAYWTKIFLKFKEAVNENGDWLIEFNWKTTTKPTLFTNCYFFYVELHKYYNTTILTEALPKHMSKKAFANCVTLQDLFSLIIYGISVSTKKYSSQISSKNTVEISFYSAIYPINVAVFEFVSTIILKNVKNRDHFLAVGLSKRPMWINAVLLEWPKKGQWNTVISHRLLEYFLSVTKCVVEQAPTGKTLNQKLVMNPKHKSPAITKRWLTLPVIIVQNSLPNTSIPLIFYEENCSKFTINRTAFDKKKLVYMASEISDSSIDAVKLTNKKASKVAVSFLKILYAMDEKIGNTDELSVFVSVIYFKKVLKKITELTNSIGDALIAKMRSIKIRSLFLAGSKVCKFAFCKTHEITMSDLNDLYRLRMLETEARALEAVRIRQNTAIAMAEIFTGFPLFFTDFFDARLRMYPNHWHISRTSGLWKYLTEDFNKQLLSVFGFQTLLRSFYKHWPEKSLALEANLCNLNSMGDLIVWNAENLKNIDRNEIFKIANKKSRHEALYLFSTVRKAALKNVTKTAVRVEIDQSSSGATFSALWLGNVSLAKQTHLLQNKQQQLGLPNYLMAQSSVFFQNKISAEALKILVCDRTFHKTFSMTFFYGHTQQGISTEIEDMWPEMPSVDRQIIANQYSNFMNFVFPGLAAGLSNFKAITKFFVNHSSASVEFKTLDDSIIKFKIFKKITGEFFNTRQRYTSNVIVTAGCVKSMQRTPGIDLTSKSPLTADKLPVHFTHAIDAAMMRMIILKTHASSGYIVIGLHDSVSCHPNFINHVYESIEDIFMSEKMLFNKSFFNALIFDSMRLHLEPQYHSEFEKLVDIFFSNRSVIELHDINVRSMYNLLK